MSIFDDAMKFVNAATKQYKKNNQHEVKFAGKMSYMFEIWSKFAERNDLSINYLFNHLYILAFCYSRVKGSFHNNIIEKGQSPNRSFREEEFEKYFYKTLDHIDDTFIEVKRNLVNYHQISNNIKLKDLGAIFDIEFQMDSEHSPWDEKTVLVALMQRWVSRKPDNLINKN